MKRPRGWSQVRPYETHVAHYLDETGVRSLCKRTAIRLTEAGVANMPPERRKRFERMELCDSCEKAVHRLAVHR